jgi:hypothetical protein
MADTSDPGCPSATQIVSGLKAGQVPFMSLAASGIGAAWQRALLVREFNRAAELLAYKHCLPDCLAKYIPATNANIKVATQDWGGWTELLMEEVSHHPDVRLAQPRILSKPTVKRGLYIDPPNPNVVCKKLPELPKRTVKPPVPEPRQTPVPTPTDDTPPQRHCRQPTFSKPAGTRILKKSIPFGQRGSPLDSGDANEILTRYVNERDADGTTQLDRDIRAVLQAWIDQVQRECDRLNPGLGCRAALDPDPTVDGLVTVSGDTAVGTACFMIYEIKLKVAVRGVCEPK